MTYMCRTETRPVRRPSAGFPHVDSMNLARSAKRPKYAASLAPSLDDARFDDSGSCVSMSTVSSLTDRPLAIDEGRPPVDPELLEK